MLKKESEEDRRAKNSKIFGLYSLFFSLLMSGCFLAPDRGAIHEGWSELTGDIVRNMGGKISGSFCLKDDLILEDEDIVVDGEDVRICLQGHVLKGTGRGSVITVVNGGKLEICDCSVSSESHILQRTDDLWLWNDSASGEDIRTVCGGMITGGCGRGGAVCVDGSFVMNAGSLAGNSSEEEYGGAVFLSGGSFLMKNGSILCNRGRKGGGVFVDGGCFTMEDGYIYWNSAGIDGGGAGIYDGSFIMKGGTVTENVSVMDGAGLYCKGPVYIGGKVSVSGNYMDSGTGRSAGDMHLAGERTVSLIKNCPLKEGALIGISSGKKPSEGKPAVICEADQDLSGIFYSCSSLYETAWTGDRMVLKIRDNEDTGENLVEGEK